MISIDEKEITEMFAGSQGIKSVFVGEDQVYERAGGYIYLLLETTA